MITISDRVDQWIHRHPFHASFMAAGQMNLSALARELKPVFEHDAGERLSLEAIILALNRHVKRLPPPDLTDFERYIGATSLQSDLSVLSISRIDSDIYQTLIMLQKLEANEEYFLYTRGAWYTALISTRNTIHRLAKQFPDSTVQDDLVGLTVRLKTGHLPTPGVCAYILQKLAWNNVNLIEVASAYNELTVIVARTDAEQALHCLMS